uniref:rhomboid protease n=1 Tax=Ditylenchus dipsaci TaxID=166011 RepID=A0A915CSZ1_9BILA
MKGTFEQSEMGFFRDSTPLRPASDLWKALGFTVVGGSVMYIIASISEYDKLKKRSQRIFQRWTSFDAMFNTDRNKLARRSSSYTEYFQNLSPAQLNTMKIIGVCALVTGAWKVPSLQPKMWQYFSNSFASKSLCMPMFLSVLSHKHLLHFGVNMYVLNSFAGAVTEKFLGVDQFNAMFFTGGLVSSLASLMHKCAIGSPIRALGISGAICTLLVYACSKMPEARLNVIFLPFFTRFVLRLEAFRPCRTSGGSLFGLVYAHWGEEFYCKHVRPYLFKKYKTLDIYSILKMYSNALCDFVPPIYTNQKLPKEATEVKVHYTNTMPFRPASDMWKVIAFTGVGGSLLYAGAGFCEYIKKYKPKKFEAFKNVSLEKLLSMKTPSVNSFITCVWAIPAMQRIMSQHFMTSFASKSLCLPMLFSNFSHASPLHLGVNMYALWNFAPDVIDRHTGVEQFNALYLTGGSYLRCYGASGAILSVFAYSCIKNNASVKPVFAGNEYSVPAQKALYALMMFDLCGLVLNWQIMDHAGHLGGSLFGMFYALYGEQWYRTQFLPRLYKFLNQKAPR